MSQVKKNTLRDLLNDLNQNPKFGEAYRRQKPYFELLSEVIRRRKELNLTQEELAKKANTQQSTISRLESGEHDIRLSTLVQIAEALEAEVEIRLVPMYGLDEKEYQRIRF